MYKYNVRVRRKNIFFFLNRPEVKKLRRLNAAAAAASRCAKKKGDWHRSGRPDGRIRRRYDNDIQRAMFPSGSWSFAYAWVTRELTTAPACRCARLLCITARVRRSSSVGRGTELCTPRCAVPGRRLIAARRNIAHERTARRAIMCDKNCRRRRRRHDNTICHNGVRCARVVTPCAAYLRLRIYISDVP